LYGTLPSEEFCGRRQVAIKAHPENMQMGTTPAGEYVVVPKGHQYRAKCRKGLVTFFPKIILIVRDPFAATWSEYQRVNSPEVAPNHPVHNQGIPLSKFDADKWEKVSSTDMLEFYIKTWRIYEEIKEHIPAERLLILKYEDLLNYSKRLEVLERMAHFVGHTNVTRQNLDCAFILSEKPSIHRRINATNMVTIDMFYRSSELVCRLWHGFSTRTKVADHGYRIWKNTDCSAYRFPVANYSTSTPLPPLESRTK
jgi:hypothetical protein